jgi:hypothetical protein
MLSEKEGGALRDMLDRIEVAERFIQGRASGGKSASRLDLSFTEALDYRGNAFSNYRQNSRLPVTVAVDTDQRRDRAGRVRSAQGRDQDGIPHRYRLHGAHLARRDLGLGIRQ